MFERSWMPERSDDQAIYATGEPKQPSNPGDQAIRSTKERRCHIRRSAMPSTPLMPAQMLGSHVIAKPECQVREGPKCTRAFNEAPLKACPESLWRSGYEGFLLLSAEHRIVSSLRASLVRHGFSSASLDQLRRSISHSYRAKKLSGVLARLELFGTPTRIEDLQRSSRTEEISSILAELRSSLAF
ncbi:hypothetical protein Nepgr_015688 [Nepenthes gracilis]|uniref:Uncharacterized protein n=1 Tax=Nepenthes gracilis TaxID=150966 RepID=A0AAD3SNQ3_NEPGR|nr:hypothetical protein Nepgr_015688 [Nepenthes gracilis]